MAQTVQLIYSPSLPTPTIKFYTTSGSSVGDAAGYALTETPAGMGHYVASIPDEIAGNPLLAVLRSAGVFESSDLVIVTGVAGSIALVGNYALEKAVAANSNLVLI